VIAQQYERTINLTVSTSVGQSRGFLRVYGARKRGRTQFPLPGTFGRPANLSELKRTDCSCTTEIDESPFEVLGSPKDVSRLEIAVCQAFLVEQFQSRGDMTQHLQPNTHSSGVQRPWSRTLSFTKHHSWSFRPRSTEQNRCAHSVGHSIYKSKRVPVMPMWLIDLA
jgi:hypothetical protein